MKIIKSSEEPKFIPGSINDPDGFLKTLQKYMLEAAINIQNKKEKNYMTTI